MPEPIENAELLAFTKTVDARSVSRAASELGVPRATVGRRLQRLEERLGVRLLRRTTRSLVLTDAGDALYRHARIALDAVEQAEQSVRRTDDAVKGDLRVSCPPFTSQGFYDLLDGFITQYPEVRLQVHFSTAHVDLRRGGYDLAIRGSSELEPGLVARLLIKSALIAVASPKYLSQHGTPRTLRDLRHHRCLSGFARGELPQTHWSDGKGKQVHVASVVAANDIAFLLHAALRGHGIAVLPEEMARPHLGRALTHVLTKVIRAETRLSVVFPEREYLPPQVRAFVDAVTAWARRDPRGLWPRPLEVRGS
jgi:DNA-binding transcriptional LysR family regulator